MIYIKELLPNPVGRDSGSEWIRLSNNGEEEATLNNWRIEDASQNTYYLKNISIKPDETIELGDSLTKVTLNNGGDKITLYDSFGEKIDSLGYTENLVEGEIIISVKLIEQNKNTEGLSASVISSGEIIPQNTNILLTALFIATTAAILFLYLNKYLLNKNE